MSEYYSMAAAFCTAAFLVSLSCLLYTLIQNRADKLQKKIYLAMLVILILNVVSEFVIAVVSPGKAGNPSAFAVLYFAKYFYFVFHAALLPLLGYYVISITGKRRNSRGKDEFSLRFP